MSQSKSQIIDERKANLPLPDDPPQPGNLESANAKGINIGSGKYEDNADSLGGRQGKDDLPGPPNDAVARSAKDASGLSKTTNDNARA